MDSREKKWLAVWLCVFMTVFVMMSPALADEMVEGQVSVTESLENVPQDDLVDDNAAEEDLQQITVDDGIEASVDNLEDAVTVWLSEEEDVIEEITWNEENDIDADDESAGDVADSLDELDIATFFEEEDADVLGLGMADMETGKAYAVNAVSDNAMFKLRNPIVSKQTDGTVLFCFGLTVDYNAVCLQSSLDDGTCMAYYAENVEGINEQVDEKTIKWEFTIPVDPETDSLELYYIKSDKSWGDKRKISFTWTDLTETERSAPSADHVRLEDAPANYKELNNYLYGKNRIVPNDLYEYTNESAEPVWEAKAAVEWNLLRKDNQDKVDLFAANLRDAVDHLEKRNAPDYPDGEYDLLHMESSLGMFHFQSPAKLVIDGDNVTLTVSTSDKKTSDRYEYLFLGVYNDIPDLNLDGGGIQGTLEGEVRTFQIPLRKNMLDSNIYYVLRYSKTYSSNAGEWYKPKTSNKYYFTLGNLRDADYSEVDAALASVPENLDLYTDESVLILNDVIQGVDRSLDFLHQDAVAAMAEEIRNAVNALIKKEADYTKVNQALASIPADLGSYTDESVAAVSAAKAMVVTGKKIDEQAAVDAMAAALEAAVKGLQLKPAAPQQPQQILPAAGTVLTDGTANYAVETPGSTVAYQGPVSKKVKKVVVPNTVAINGVTYTVDSIAPNAFKNCKNLTSAAIPSNITSIGANAFAGTKSLKNVTIKSKQIKKIGKKAFYKSGSKNYKKLKVKVPKSKLKAYTKLLKNAKLSSKAKVTK